MGEPVNQLTLADIARLAGVSTGTASRAMNNAYGVASATRQRVLAIAAEHSYVISPEASRLAGGSTGRIAVVVPHLSRWFFGEIVEALSGILRGAGYDVLLYHVPDLEQRHEFFDTLPARRKVDAVVVIAFPVAEAERQRLALLGAPIVAAGGQQAEYLYASIDDRAAGRQALDYLLMLGHERIAMIESIDPDQPTTPSGRSAAYYEALAEAGIPLDPDLVVTADFGGQHGAEAAARLLSLRRRPTAIYTQFDEVAAGALRTIRRAGLRVPEDISVIGIDDHPIADLLDLTTVRQPVSTQGVVAANLALACLRGETDRTQSVVLPTQLIVRFTTAPPSRRGVDSARP